jgi:hypothetical protein
MTENTRRPIISQGEVERLSKIPFHKDVEGITRRLMLSPKLQSDAPLHIAVHQVRLNSEEIGSRDYAAPHKHDFDEVNILWSEHGVLSYRFIFDGKESIVKSPASIVIPAGVIHQAEAVSGEGTFVCILLK